MEVRFKVDIQKTLRILICVATPFAYVVNPYILLVMILLQLVLFSSGQNTDDSFCIMFLLANLYPSISLAGFKVYDLIIVLAFIALVIRIKGHILVKHEGLVFLVVVLFIAIFHWAFREVTEMFRYFISISLCFLLMNMNPQISKLKDRIIEIIICNLYNALTVYIMLKNGIMQKFEGPLYSVNMYEYASEIRFNGFFSDPNKYMSFCITLILIIDLFWENGRKKTAAITLLCISSIFSLSRMGILILFVYLFIKLLIKLYQTDKRMFMIILSVLVVVSIKITLNLQIMEKFINDFFFWSTKILGRTHTLEINKSIAEDNRILIWKYSIEFINQHLIVGYGWSANEVLLPYPTHNTILSLLLDGGCFAVIAYIFVMRKLLFNSRWTLIIPLVVMPMLTLDMGAYRLYFFVLGLIWRYPEVVNRQANFEISNNTDEKVWN